MATCTKVFWSTTVARATNADLISRKHERLMASFWREGGGQSQPVCGGGVYEAACGGTGTGRRTERNYVIAE
jgi:hypothetical protein